MKTTNDDSFTWKNWHILEAFIKNRFNYFQQSSLTANDNIKQIKIIQTLKQPFCNHCNRKGRIE